VLLRLRPVDSGAVWVHGVDAATLGLRHLRACFGVVPQQPLLFAGSLRDNLDPHGAASDQQLAATLQAVHMWAPLCRIALQRGLLGHSTYLMARRAGNLARAGYGGSSTPTAGGAAAAAAAPAAAAAAAAGPCRVNGATPAAAAGGQGQGAHAHDDDAAAAAEAAAIASEWSMSRHTHPAAPFPGSRRDDVGSRTMRRRVTADASGAGGALVGSMLAAGRRGVLSASVSLSASAAAAGDIVLNTQLLQEGGALAAGAAAGAAVAAPGPQAGTSLSSSRQATRRRGSGSGSGGGSGGGGGGGGSGGADGSGAAAGRASSSGSGILTLRLGRIRRSSENMVLPPVPLHPAHKVLAMQVGGPGAGVCLSVGQAQLVCLARMLLKRAPLVLLDEATAAVDPRTAGLIHRVLHAQFDGNTSGGSPLGGSPLGGSPLGGSPLRGSSPLGSSPLGSSPRSSAGFGPSAAASSRPTVIQVAHELPAILSYDSVIVMAGGRVVEQGTPQALAAERDSQFSQLLAMQQQGHAV
jgi:hypothetical protein